MEEKLINSILRATVFLVLAIAMLLLATGINPFSSEGMTKMSIFFTVITFFWAFYFRWGWKLPLIKHIAYKENLNGTWVGKYKSLDNIEGKEYQGEIALVIRQNFLTTSVVSLTDKYVSFSYGASVLYNSGHDNNQLVYLYSQNEFNPTDNQARKGASELHLISGDKEKKLFGTFWTNHNSQGNLDLTFVSTNHFSSFKDIKKKKNGN